MSFPPFIRDVNTGESVPVQPGITYRVDPDGEAERMAEARKDPAAVSVARCTHDGCPVTGTADKPISSALLIHRMESHAAASGHVVAIEVRPDPEPAGG